jgi:hypothetical protein
LVIDENETIAGFAWTRIRSAKNTLAAPDCALTLRAEIFVARQAFVTGQAVAGRPADANSLTDLEAFGSFPEGHHRADRLVPGYEWILR